MSNMTRCWEATLAPLQEQQALLASRPSIQESEGRKVKIAPEYKKRGRDSKLICDIGTGYGNHTY